MQMLHLFLTNRPVVIAWDFDFAIGEKRTVEGTWELKCAKRAAGCSMIRMF